MRTLLFALLASLFGYTMCADAAPSTQAFMNALSTCAINLKITISGNLVGSIKSLYDGNGVNGEAILEQQSNFIDLFPEAERQRAYQLYTICVQSALDPSHFNPFIIDKIHVNKTKFDFVTQRLGNPNTDEQAEFRKGNIATFPVGGFTFRVYYFPSGISGKDDDLEDDAQDLSFSAGTVVAISVAIDPDESQKPLVLDGYWVWWGCDVGQDDCQRYGSRKPLGTLRLSNLANEECYPYVTGGTVGWNQEPDKVVFECPGNPGSSGAHVVAACDLPDDANYISHIMYLTRERDSSERDGDATVANDYQNSIDNVKGLTANAPDEKYFEPAFWKSVKDCVISDYAVVGDSISVTALFEGAEALNFSDWPTSKK